MPGPVSLARSLGDGGAPVEPPGRLAVRRPLSTRARWLGLAAFAAIGSLAIVIASGSATPDAEVSRVWQGAAPDDPVPVAPTSTDAVYSIAVDGLPALGRADAPVTLVVVTDYACVACEQAIPMVRAWRASYGDDLRIVWKPHATADARAASAGACAAAELEAFARYDELAWRRTVAKSAQLGLPIALPDHAAVVRLARELELDADRFGSAMRSCEPRVATSTRELDRLGVHSPAYFVNGRRVDPWDTESAPTWIDRELARAHRRIAAGAPAASYYRDWVLVPGQTTR